MKIGELSARSGVSQRSLRYYEQHGLIDAERGANNYRDYGEEAVEKARNLRLLFELGIDRELARSVIACSGEVSSEVHRMTAGHLREVRDRMTARLAELAAARSTLDVIISRADGATASS